MPFRMKSALIGAAVSVVLDFWIIAWMVPATATPAEVAAYWISQSFFGTLMGLVVGGFSSKRRRRTGSRIASENTSSRNDRLAIEPPSRPA